MGLAHQGLGLVHQGIYNSPGHREGIVSFYSFKKEETIHFYTLSFLSNVDKGFSVGTTG